MSRWRLKSIFAKVAQLSTSSCSSSSPSEERQVSESRMPREYEIQSVPLIQLSGTRKLWRIPYSQSSSSPQETQTGSWPAGPRWCTRTGWNGRPAIYSHFTSQRLQLHGPQPYHFQSCPPSSPVDRGLRPKRHHDIETTSSSLCASAADACWPRRSRISRYYWSILRNTFWGWSFVVSIQSLWPRYEYVVSFSFSFRIIWE